MDTPSPIERNSKRHSLLTYAVVNDASTKTSVTTTPTRSGPRPLQLINGPISPSPLSAPGSGSGFQSVLDTPSSPITVSSPLRRTHNPRRQSSISYAPRDRDWALRSSTSQLGRSSSLHGKTQSVSPSSPVSSKREGDNERGPLTLAEKHADLLHFIAQKESKCLELRSQLAVHEAELLALKRKWERIVSRGISGPATPLEALSVSNINGQAAVLEGIKGGVQGVSRFIAGLGELAPPSPVPGTSGSIGFGTASAIKQAKRQSMSSVSTQSSSATRLSHSSMSSILDTEDDVCGPDERPNVGKGAVVKANNNNNSTSSRRSFSSETDDITTAQTSGITISGRTAKTYRRKSREYSAQLALTSLDSPTDGSFSVSPVLPTSSTATQVSSDPHAVYLSGHSQLKSPVSPVGVAVPPISSWVGAVNKKWSELQRHQKRASVIISDVSSTFLAALASPSPLSSTATSSYSPSPRTPSDLVNEPTSEGSDNRLEVEAQHSRPASSLLEDDDQEDVFDKWDIDDTTLSLKKVTPLVPDQVKSSSAGAVATHDSSSESNLLSEEDAWNW